MALEANAKSCSETLYCLIAALDYPSVKVLQKSSLKSAVGVFVTTSHFTSQAHLESQETGHKPIVLIDGIRFSEIVFRLNVPLEKYITK
jgi:restriction endonuclease Mrr